MQSSRGRVRVACGLVEGWLNFRGFQGKALDGTASGGTYEQFGGFQGKLVSCLVWKDSVRKQPDSEKLEKAATVDFQKNTEGVDKILVSVDPRSVTGCLPSAPNPGIQRSFAIRDNLPRNFPGILLGQPPKSSRKQPQPSRVF